MTKLSFTTPRFPREIITNKCEWLKIWQLFTALNLKKKKQEIVTELKLHWRQQSLPIMKMLPT